MLDRPGAKSASFSPLSSPRGASASASASASSPSSGRTFQFLDLPFIPRPARTMLSACLSRCYRVCVSRAFRPFLIVSLGVFFFLFAFALYMQSDYVARSTVCESMFRSPPRPVLASLETPRFEEFFVAIFHHSNIPMLLRALESTQPIFLNRVLVVDNSDTLEAFHSAEVRHLAKVYAPPVQLHFTQTQNLVQAIAIASGVRWFAFMHSDAVLKDCVKLTGMLEDAILRFETGTGGTGIEAGSHGGVLDAITSLPGSTWHGYDDASSRSHVQPTSGSFSWGAIFTNYDAFVVFNPTATAIVGQWDVYYFQYTSDIDYYERIRVAGFPLLQLGEELVLHEVSGTIKSNACFKKRSTVIGDYGRLYFSQKWGPPMSEIDIGRAEFEFPFEYDLYKLQLSKKLFGLSGWVFPLTLLTYWMFQRKLLSILTFTWLVTVVLITIWMYPMRQLLFDSGLLSK
eukprot:ANDGO_06076.mRNA.1 hypothetical protein